MVAFVRMFSEAEENMGKWSEFKGKLDQAPVESSWQGKVDATKPEYQELNVGQLGEKYNEFRIAKERLQEELGEVNTHLEALSQLVIDELERLGLSSVKLADGSSINMKDEPYSRVKDQHVFLSWIREQGLDSLLTVNYQTMNAMVKDRLITGDEPPPGIDVFIKTSITRRKG